MTILKGLWKSVLCAFLALMLFAYPIEAVALSSTMVPSETPALTSNQALLSTDEMRSMNTETLYDGFYNAAQQIEQTVKKEVNTLKKEQNDIDGSLISCLVNCSGTTNTGRGSRPGTQLSIFGAVFGVMFLGLGHSFYHWKKGDVPASIVNALFMATILKTLLVSWFTLMSSDLMIVSALVLMVFVSVSMMTPFGLAPDKNAAFARSTLAHAPKVNVTLNGHTKEVTLVPHNYRGSTSGIVFRETGDSTGIFKGNLREIVPSNMVKLLTSANKENMKAQIWIPRTRENGTPTAIPSERIVTIIPTKMLKITPKQALELLKAGSRNEDSVGWKEVSKALSPKGQRSGEPLNGSVLIIPAEFYNQSEVALWKDAAKQSGDGAQSGRAMKSSVLVVPGDDV